MKGKSTMYTHLYEVLCNRAKTYPDAVAVSGQQDLVWKTVSGREMLDLVDRLAVELETKLYVANGDRVVLWVPNGWRTPIYMFAVWKLGAIAVPFDKDMNPRAASSIIDKIEPKCIITGYHDRPPWLAETRGSVEWWEPGSECIETPHLESSWTVPEEPLAAIYFTSGTTGDPKGCMITHANLCFEVEVLKPYIPLDPSCRLASILPLSHLYELTAGLLCSLNGGASIHYVPSRRSADIVRVMQEQHITHMIAVPQLLIMMGNALDEQLRTQLPAPIYRMLFSMAAHLPLPVRHRLFWFVHRKLGGQLRLIVSGGAPLPVQTQHLWELLGVEVLQGYGASECSPVITAPLPGIHTPAGSVGKAVLGTEVKFSPEGELLVRGPHVMQGYWRDPERTEATFCDGWYATGDLGRGDADGNIWLSGRAKDLIVLPSGMKVWPDDVEDVLRSHPAIKDTVVIPVPNELGGATLHAYLIPNQPDQPLPDIETIVAECNGKLALHQRIATAAWWQSETGDFPRTAMLKVRRHLIPKPDQLSSVKIESIMAADDPVSRAVAGIARVPSVQPNQKLGDLGLDSLGLVELATSLEEKTGKTVSDGDLGMEMTVEQLHGLIAKAPDLDQMETLVEGEHPVKGEVKLYKVPDWPYTWGRYLRFVAFPFDVLYWLIVPRTIIIGKEHLQNLAPTVIFAGTHHSFADVPLLRQSLSHTAANWLVPRLIVGAEATGFGKIGLTGKFAILAFGLYPLQKYGGRDQSMRDLVKLAAKGNAILFFPQGAHVRIEEELANAPIAQFHDGISYLAKALDTAVVPFGLAGTEKVMPSLRDEFHGKLIAGIPISAKRRPLAIAFGAPVKMNPDEDPHAFAARLQALCYTLTRRAEQALAKAEAKPVAQRVHGS